MEIAVFDTEIHDMPLGLGCACFIKNPIVRNWMDFFK